MEDIQMIPNWRLMRKEVGCQWESPVEEERREVACQSDSVERRDAGVQVDLLTQKLSLRHSGVWQCVSVRADEPGGGALLQHCSSHNGQPNQSSALYLLCPPLIPSMPLVSPTESKELLQPHSLSSMPQSESIPFLSQDTSPYLQSSPFFSMPLCGMSPTAEGRGDSSPPPTPADVSAAPSGLIAPLSPCLVKEEEGEMKEEEKPRVRKKKVKEEVLHREEGGVQPVKIEIEQTEQVGRPRRMKVGPPIRYLLESEEQSLANHSRGREAKVKKKLAQLRAAHQEHQEEDMRMDTEGGWVEQADSIKVESPGDGQVDGWWQFCQVCGLNFTSQASLQLHLSIHRGKRRLRTLHQHHYHHGNRDRVVPGGARATDDKLEEWEVKALGDEERSENEVQKKPLLLVPTKAPDRLRCIKRVCRKRPLWVSHQTLMKRRRRQEENIRRGRKRKRYREEEVEDKEWKPVCVNERGDGKEQVKWICAKWEVGEGKEEVKEQLQRPRRTMVSPPIRYIVDSDEPIITNQHTAIKHKQERGGPKKVVTNSEVRGRSSEMNYRSEDAERQTSHMTTDEVEAREEVKEQPPRPRRTMVGPPIRYLVQSEEPRITNQDAAKKHEPKGDRPKKGVSDSESEMIDGSKAAERQAGHMTSERQAVHLTSGRPMGHMIPEKQMGQMTLERQTGHMTTERQRGVPRQIYLLYTDLQSGHVTLVPPCSVRLQRL